MRLLIKQRVFSWTDSYDVYDENENAKYFVKAEFFSLGHQLHIYDRNDRELGVISSIIHISKELFHWGDTYTINFADPKDELEGLMLVIAIDAANCTQNNG